ncbi:MAG: hypothetical protein LBR31_05730 [Desulfovibrio sp.]|jgi:hypothetical protein|nr:hypothetical protein [Desulfovibrio sp.]
MLRSGLFFLLLFLLVPVFVASSPAGEAERAADCLVRINHAVEDADTEAFQRLADVDAILNTGFTAFLREVEAMQKTGDIPPLLALLFSPAAMRNTAGEQVRALLVAETKAFVLNGIASGTFAGRPSNGRAAQGLLAPLFADASIGRKEIRDIGQARAEGNDWLVPFVVLDHGNGESYPVLGRVSPGEDGFRLTAVENLGELVRRINEERKLWEEGRQQGGSGMK